MDPKVPQLRVDAQDNRDRILAAARSLFFERGLDVGLREIARRAQLGPATLYRRFPTRQSLIDEAFSVELHACRKIVEEGCAQPDPWQGFTSVIRRLIALNVQNRGFVDAFTSTDPANGVISEHRRELLRMLSALAQKARKNGDLRADFTIDDLVLILSAGRGLALRPPGARDRAAQRFAELSIDGLRPRAGHVT